jgi:carbon monoxide dehydrogenase subunit G
MASVHREVLIERPAEAVWDALADVGALHTRLAPGFVTDCKLEPGARVVTFFNGMVARELIVAVDPASRRIAWAVVGGRLTHHNASAQAFAEGGACRVVWIADFLPDEFAASGAAMIEAGLAAMKKALEFG